MKISAHPQLLQKLAAEYVLGTLRGGARRRFDALLQQDPKVLQAVREWQAHLLPMAEFVSSQPVSAEVWLAVERRLGLLKKNDRWEYWRQLRQDLSFWRGLGLVSTTAALVLVSVLLSQHAELSLPTSPTYVATLADEKAQTQVLISGNRAKGKMTVRMVQAQAIAANQSLELWSIAKDGKIRSLGLIAANGEVELALPDFLVPEATNILAISLEPKGGSGNPEKPSGPILFKGVWLQV